MTKSALTAIPKAYANIFFVEHPALGMIFIAATFLYPNIGAAGLLAATCGYLFSRLFHFPQDNNGIQIFNSLLVGLSLGAFYQLNIYLAAIIILGALLAVLISVSMADGLWRHARLPTLSIPFILVVLVTTPVARRYSSLTDFIELAKAQFSPFTPWIDGFLSSLGSIFFTPQPIAGLLMFLAVVVSSRFLAAMAFAGYGLGYLAFNLLADNPHPSLVVWTGFNYSLTAIAIAGFYTVPSLAGIMIAMMAVVLSAMMVVATQDFLMLYGLPIMAIPFVVTTIVTLGALNHRRTLVQPWLAPQPGLPEVNYERARLAKVRNGELDSVPLLAPFLGEWEVYQGFNGEHTHREAWRHALDFYMTEAGKSFQGRGLSLEDYFCFGLPVVSPVHGMVVRAMDALPDNRPGEVDVKNNWGNFILIRLQSGLHVLLAHLRQHSLKVKEGEYITPGKEIAACGNSGRSPQPHIHLQVQNEANLSSPTHNFHLTNVLKRIDNRLLEYQLVATPKEGETVQASKQDDVLAGRLHLPVGRILRYQISAQTDDDNNKRSFEIELKVELSLLGQFRLRSSSGASVAFEEINGILAFYDRQGNKDVVLDAWILAHGITPFAENATIWRDSPSARLMPMTSSQRLWLWWWRPLGCGLTSEYQRSWDESNSIWVQSATHNLSIGGKSLSCSSESFLSPINGFSRFKLAQGAQHWLAILVDTGLVEDRGVPGWRQTKQGGAVMKTAHSNQS